MQINSYNAAISACVNILNTLDQLTVKGRGNCLMVAGVSNDVEALARFLDSQRPVPSPKSELEPAEQKED